MSRTTTERLMESIEQKIQAMKDAGIDDDVIEELLKTPEEVDEELKARFGLTDEEIAEFGPRSKEIADRVLKQFE